MPTKPVSARWLWSAGAGVLALSAVGCAGSPSTAGLAAPPIPPGQARIWFYRVWEPSISVNLANVALNGVAAGSVLPSVSR